jgi:hypothetical protein
MTASTASRRDLFAAAALPECIRVAEGQTTEPEPLLSELFGKAAGFAFFAADAMLVASGEGVGPGVIAELEDIHRRVLEGRGREVTAKQIAVLILRLRQEAGRG